MKGACVAERLLSRFTGKCSRLHDCVFFFVNCGSRCLSQQASSMPCRIHKSQPAVRRFALRVQVVHSSLHSHSLIATVNCPIMQLPPEVLPSRSMFSSLERKVGTSLKVQVQDIPEQCAFRPSSAFIVSSFRAARRAGWGPLGGGLGVLGAGTCGVTPPDSRYLQ